MLYIVVRYCAFANFYYNIIKQIKLEKFEIEFNPCAILSPIFNTKQLEE